MNTQSTKSNSLPSQNHQLRQPPLLRPQKSHDFQLVEQRIKKFNHINSTQANINFSVSRNTIQAVTQAQIDNFNRKLADKNHVQQESAMLYHQPSTVKPFHRRLPSDDEVQVRKKLQSKMTQAFEKLEDLKQTVIKHQKVKAEIIAKSHSRRHSLHV